MILEGYSKSKVEILQKNNFLFVRKTGDIDRNLERYDAFLNIDLKMPKIIKKNKKYYDMEFIKHISAKEYLQKYNADKLIDFIKNTIKILSKKTLQKDYSIIYQKKLSSFDWKKYNLPFTKEKLYDKLPKILPESMYFGDLTLENILCGKNNFILIDPLTTEYDSYVFDLAKLKQDTICKWFVRNESFNFGYKLDEINQELKCEYDNNYLVILMLMRVLPYSKNYKDKLFIENEIDKLWK
jgi:hypothetical protein